MTAGQLWRDKSTREQSQERSSNDSSRSNTQHQNRRTQPHLDRIHRRAQADYAQRVVLAALHLVFTLLPHGPRQPFAPRVVGLGRHRSNARRSVLLPVTSLASLAAVVGDLALRASAQRGTPALLLAEEAGEQVDPLDRLFLGVRLLALTELLATGVLVASRRRDVGTGERLDARSDESLRSTSSMGSRAGLCSRGSMVYSMNRYDEGETKRGG